MAHIEIVEDADVVSWQFIDPSTKQVFDSKFKLRVVTSSLQRELRRKYTKHEFVRGTRQENFDWAKFNDDCIDFAVVEWTEVKRKGVDIPCTRENKLLLPEMVKAEIIRLCLGKELGEIVAGEDEQPQDEMEGEQSPRPPDGVGRIRSFNSVPGSNG